MMDQVSVHDARNTLSALLDRVEQGDEVVITRRGRPVAKLIGAGPVAHGTGVIEKLRILREDIAATGERFTWDELKEMRDEGRR